MAGVNMRAEEIMELGPVQHQNYTMQGRIPYEVKSRKVSTNPRDYDFSPTDSGIERQLYSQVDKKLKPIASKLGVLKSHAKDKSLFQQILDKETYIQMSIDEEHVDSCEIGGCQYTAHAIARAFGGTDPEVVGVFGEIETDEGRNADDGGFMTHHWVEIDGIPYDFAKGTLGDYVNWHDIYDDDLGNDDWRYHPIHKKEYNIQ
jgi:hypothetical protein